jgi:hypothetical protein
LNILRAEKLNTYRFCDNVWTFMLKDVEFREHAEINKVDRVKIGRTHISATVKKLVYFF